MAILFIYVVHLTKRVESPRMRESYSAEVLIESYNVS
jgi:hypothetical protein